MNRRQSIRFWWIAAAFLGGVATAMFAEELILRAQGNRLDFSTPRLHIISGRPLARLRNAEPVAFDFQATVASTNRTNVIKRNTARFVISYDLWEERFAVTKTTPARKTASHLTAMEAEVWCVQEMSMDLNGVAANQPLFASMDIRAVEESETRLFGRGNITDAGISLTSLLERFSRPSKSTQPHWNLEVGPITLEQLRRGG
ncbi:MAG: hypothetical protein ABIR70_14905 [Bryobacteraceae bacterium]